MTTTDQIARLRAALSRARPLVEGHVPERGWRTRQEVVADIDAALADTASGEGGERPMAELRRQAEEYSPRDDWKPAPPPQPTPGDEERAQAIVRVHVRSHRRENNMGEFPAAFFADELTEAIAAALRAARADAVEQIAQLAEEKGRIWVKEGVRLAAGQGNPFPKFAAEIREKFKV